MAGSSAQAEGGRSIDATGMIVFPGGVDVHTHVAGGALNFARGLVPENQRAARKFLHTPELRSGLGGMTPTTFATGYLYAGMGWTTVNEAAVPILSARHTHEELHDIPIVDKTSLVLMGNNEIVLDLLESGDERAGAARRRLADLGRQSLRREGGQPRRRRRLEVGEGREDALRTGGRLQPGDAGEDHRQPGAHRRRAGTAASAPSSLQQPRRPGQRRHHDRNDEGAGRAPGPHGAPAIPRLRRRRLEHDALRIGAARRVLQHATRTSPPMPARSCSAMR